MNAHLYKTANPIGGPDDDLIDVVRTLCSFAARMRALPADTAKHYPSPIAEGSPLLMAARAACLRRGYTADGLALPGMTAIEPIGTGQAVAWCRRHPDGTLTDELLPDARIGELRKLSGAWVALAPMGRSQVQTVTMSGRQLREAIGFINPDGPDAEEQLDDELTFGVVQHKDDDDKASVGLCCWNDDTDGVYPLTGDGPYAAAVVPPSAALMCMACLDTRVVAGVYGRQACGLCPSPADRIKLAYAAADDTEGGSCD